MAKKKYYVVWNGVSPGIYDNWTDCKLQVAGYEGAKYKSFDSREEADDALEKGYHEYLKKASSPKATHKLTIDTPTTGTATPVWNSISVDAACSGNPGDMEYRGVYTATKQELFHIGPLKKGTNNVGEFLALVHGLAFLKQKGSDLPVYSDSVNAIKWVQKKKAKTLLERIPENEPIFDLIERAEKWLKTNTYSTQILKWQTTAWGEIPADFGRK
ncbi:ribonuclease H [Parabacteroides sp. 52]|uniref:ribonuclease H1 domain-containing protein n=1 Tax=unclassified Parabacteroides TaxID=2649774 RepID=UPI0013D21CC5|nr:MULTISPECIES: ribonuclease H family protein [unclassified Parabacteroides]MDH6534846.1 ribonuclease HI [Parabacteroides sp. PM5-20]NDV55563.1 ribonuclease H [Parabacteroides sp. 52]